MEQFETGTCLIGRVGGWGGEGGGVVIKVAIDT